jgi:hypothetical protein
MANQSGVTWPDLINPRVRTAIGELYDHVFCASRDSATIGCRRVPHDGSRQIQRRLPPEEVEELVAAYLVGATALTLIGDTNQTVAGSSMHSPPRTPPGSCVSLSDARDR